MSPGRRPSGPFTTGPIPLGRLDTRVAVATVRLAAHVRPKGALLRKLLIATCVSALLLCGSAAAAPGPVVDQSFTTPGGATASINDCCALVAQTFTAGRDGLLAGVNVDTRNPVFTVPSLRVSIRNVEGSVPGETVLATTITPTALNPLSRLITFPQTVQVRAGVMYAIVINVENPPTSVAAWDGATGNPYPRGAACGKYKPGVLTEDWFCYTPEFGFPSFAWFDNHFRTYVTAAPTTKDDCKNGGWRNFGVFKNQGDCVSFVATKGKNQPAGP
jgi:hypothetical protein